MIVNSRERLYVSSWCSLGSGLNGGWYNTAKSHSLGGFDVTAGLHIISILIVLKNLILQMTLTNFKFR